MKLEAFQKGFALALLDPQRPMPPAFAVYRNTVMKGCIDALQANFPAVARLVGGAWFRAAAAVYARAHPPRAPMLLAYGDNFPDFLASFEPAAELPYLSAVARLDRFWSEAHVARDEATLGAQALAGLDPSQLGALRLRPHASARWAWFDCPAYTIWSRQREPAAGGDVDWRAEGALILRPADAVRWMPLGRAEVVFLDACGGGRTSGEAAEAALSADPAINLCGLIASLLAAGAFSQRD
jgi:hypothetical protein